METQPGRIVGVGSRLSKKMWVLIAVSVLILGGIAYAYFAWPKKEENVSAPVADDKTNLGTEIYGQVENPINDKLPETVTPVPNPLEGAYQNPFE